MDEHRTWKICLNDIYSSNCMQLYVFNIYIYIRIHAWCICNCWASISTIYAIGACWRNCSSAALLATLDTSFLPFAKFQRARASYSINSNSHTSLCAPFSFFDQFWETCPNHPHLQPCNLPFKSFQEEFRMKYLFVERWRCLQRPC